MLEYVERIDNLATECRRLKNAQSCLDLLRMCDTAHAVATELSKELVECRRRNKLSPRSKDLLEQLEEYIANVEKMLTFAKLMDPPRWK